MIHQVSRLPGAERLLLDIVALQIAGLEAASLAGVTKAIVENRNNFRPVLAGHLATKRRFRDKANEITEWVVAKETTLLDPLSKFTLGTQIEKDSFVSGVKQDVALLLRPRTGTLSVAILGDAPGWKVGAKDFLYNFYDLWRTPGFQNELFSSPTGSAKKYTRLDFVDEFIAMNPSLYLCAICDGSAYKTTTEAQVFTSVEHFFPRSIYPHLSCHPRNLIPICSHCNSYIKGDENPLHDYSLLDFVLPYQQPASRFSNSAFIAVVRRDPPDRTKHPLRIELRQARNETLGRKLEAFNHLYKVDERWSTELEQIEEQAFRRILQFLTLAGPGNPIPDQNKLKDYLRMLMAITDKENVGKDPFAFPMVWLLKSYIEQIDEHEAEAKIYKALKTWADTNNDRWKVLDDHALLVEARKP